MSSGGSSGGGGNTTTTQKQEPWSAQIPYLQTGFAKASDLYKSGGPQYYPGQTLASMSTDSTDAIKAAADYGRYGNPLTNASQSSLNDTIQGKYLNVNPYLEGNFNAGADVIKRTYNDTVNAQNSSFAGAGRSNSGMSEYYKNLQNDTLAKNLNNLYSQTYYNNYNNERANMLNATQLAPTYADLQAKQAEALSNAGAAQDEYQQSVINANVDRYNYNQNLEANNLARFMNFIQGNYGGTATGGSTYTPTYSSPSKTNKVLSGAATGAAIGSVVPGIGTGVGAAVGGGLALFSDRRLKYSIRFLTKLSNGLNLYRYCYKFLPGVEQIGVMADEVEKILPQAIINDVSGYKKVNYGMLGA